MNRTLRPIAPAVIIVSLVLLGPLARSAAGQIATLPGASPEVIPGAYFGGGVARGANTAYDPINDVRLVVSSYGPTYGVFINGAGVPVTTPFLISNDDNGWGHFPGIAFSPDLADGNGGFGAFLVTWNGTITAAGTTNHVHARVVSYTAATHLVGSTFIVSDGESVFWEVGHVPSIAYSPTSRTFMIVWRSFATYNVRVRALTIDGAGAPVIGATSTVSTGNAQNPSIA